MSNQRLSKEEYYLNIAKEVAERSTCFRNKGGAIIVRGDQIIATGYIGAPRKTKDCFDFSSMSATPEVIKSIGWSGDSFFEQLG